MKPAGIHHVAICVRNLDESIRFYTDALGFTVAPRPDSLGMDGAWLDAAGQQVHLMVSESPDLPRGNHFAVRVDDLHAAVEDLKARGIEPFVLDPPIPGAGRQAFLNDPTGNSIELNQPDT
ncbi:MAG: lactoylglutathione lyase family protein [Acidimicrobiales bacterium]|jgi:catechol 2,3-dioxygenase-like lactoylglutathione lyase family enzyme|nr:lactoylglutathione lyase family protein [Acidimicrobiales bacterium]